MAFKILDGEYAIISSGGVEKQVPIAVRNNILYAVAFGGYIALRYDATTSKDKVRLLELSVEFTLYKTRLGKLAVAQIEGGQKLDQLLLTSE